MFQTVLNYVFISRWVHIVLLALTGIGVAYMLIKGFFLWFGHPPECPWGLYYLSQLVTAAAIWACFFIPPFIFDPGRTRFHVLTGLATPVAASGMCFVIALVAIAREVIRDWWKEKKDRKKLMEQLKKREIPEKFPFLGFKSIGRYSLKNIRKISSPFPVAYNWIRELKPLLDGKKCLEVSCRLGMLSKAMHDLGIDVIATGKKDYSSEENPDWCEIERISAVEAVRKYGKEISYIICFLPERKNPDVYQALKELIKINPECKLILAGRIDGCKNDSDFSEENEYIKRINIVTSWPAAHISLVDIGEFAGQGSNVIC